MTYRLECSGAAPQIMSGLQPAHLFYAAAQRSPWAPFLPFPAPLLTAHHRLETSEISINSLNGSIGSSLSTSHSADRTMRDPPSEDSNDDRGKFIFAAGISLWCLILLLCFALIVYENLVQLNFYWTRNRVRLFFS